MAEQVCQQCGSADNITWSEVSGHGNILGFVVIYDFRPRLWQPDQPFNSATIRLEEDPAIMFYSNLPGTPVDQVPVEAMVRVEFQEVESGQRIPE